MGLKRQGNTAEVVGAGRVISYFDSTMGKNFYFNLAFFKRFYRQLRIVMPTFLAPTTLLFIALLIIVIAELVVVFFIGIIPSHYLKILIKKDLDEFWKRTWKSLLVVIAMAIVLSAKKFTWTLFYIKSREMLTKSLHRLYLDDINFYKLNVLDDSVDNIDQRIARDVDEICFNFGQIAPDLLVTPFNIGYYSYLTWVKVGYTAPVSVYIFFIISTIINKFLMSPIVALTAEQEYFEGEFRYKHMHLRLNSESAAFYRAGQTEGIKIEQKLESMLTAQKRVNNREIFLSLSMNVANYFGTVLSYSVIAIPIFRGDYDSLEDADLSSFISKSAFLILYLIFNFTRLINMAPEVSNMAGSSHRIGELLETLENLEKNKNCDDLMVVVDKKDPMCEGEFGRKAYIISNLDVVLTRKTSDRKLLCRDLNLKISTGCSLLITGDSGTGKTSLLRTLDGLWPLQKGRIERYMIHGRGGVYYLPQKPYLTNGSLRDQIIFPDTCYTVDNDNEIFTALEVAGLEGLPRRTGGLDKQMDWHWEDILSPGEAQRLAFVRLFYHRPAVAVLDEATSQISESLEKTLYEYCVSLKMTLVSIGHRMTLANFHDQRLKLSEDGSWDIEWLNGLKCPMANRVCPFASLKDCKFHSKFQVDYPEGSDGSTSIKKSLPSSESVESSISEEENEENQKPSTDDNEGGDDTKF